MSLPTHYDPVIPARARRVSRWLLPCMAMALYSAAAYPAIYKCKDANGSIVYSNTKCASDTNDVTPELIKKIPKTGGLSSGSRQKRGYGASPSPDDAPPLDP